MRDMKSYFSAAVEHAFKNIISAMDQRTNGAVKLLDPNFIDTPGRVARAYEEIFSGLFAGDGAIEEILKTTFPSASQEMIQVGPIDVWSVCPHHFLPVHLHVWVAYIPSQKVLGLSKLPRLVELLAKKPVLQEDLTVGITEAIGTHLGPQGVACLIRGRHFCMEMRGVHKATVTTTTSLIGKFLDGGPRAEFLAAVRQDMPGGL